MPGNRRVIEQIRNRLIHAGTKVGEAVIDRKSRGIVGEARRFTGQVLLDGARAGWVDNGWKIRRLRTCPRMVSGLDLQDSQAHAVSDIADKVLAPVGLVEGVCSHQVRIEAPLVGAPLEDFVSGSGEVSRYGEQRSSPTRVYVLRNSDLAQLVWSGQCMIERGIIRPGFPAFPQHAGCGF